MLDYLTEHRLARAAAGRVSTRRPSEHEPELSYEQARAELAAVVEKLEAGGTTLEESLALWERGEQLAEMCQRWLDAARARLGDDAAVKGWRRPAVAARPTTRRRPRSWCDPAPAAPMPARRPRARPVVLPGVVCQQRLAVGPRLLAQFGLE